MPHYEFSSAAISKILQPLSSLALLTTLFSSGLVGAQTLDRLSDIEKEDVEKVCLPIQFQSGAEAYRECITDQIKNKSLGSAIPVSELSFAEQYAIQQYCQKSGPIGSVDHDDCKTSQADEVQSLSSPQLQRLAEDERHAVQQDCVYIQNTGGAKAYRQCLNDTISAVLAIPEPDLSSLSLEERNALQPDCIKPPANAVDYRTCLLQAVNGASKTTVEPTTLANATTSAETIRTPVAEVADTILTTDRPQSGFEDSPVSQNNAGEITAGNKPVETPDITATLNPVVTGVTNAANEVTSESELSTENISTLANQATPDSNSVALSSQLPGVEKETGLNTEPATNVRAADQPESAEFSSTQLETRPLQPEAALTNKVNPPQTTELLQQAAKPVELKTADPIPTDTSAPQTQAETNSSPDVIAQTATQINPQANAQTAADVEAQPAQNPGSDDPIDKIKSAISALPTRIQNLLANLSGTSRMIVMAAVALPLLLIAFWLLIMRRREPEPDYIPPAHPHPLVDRIGPSQQKRDTTRTEQWSHPDEPNDSTDLSRQIDDLLGDTADNQQDLPVHDPEPLPLEPASAPAVFTPTDTFEPQPNPGREPSPEPLATAADADPAEGDASNDSAHGNVRREPLNTSPPPVSDETARSFSSKHMPWLMDKEPEDQLSLAIEFLVYWMAYGDERYELELKKKVFSLAEPNDHDLIKRHVLMGDFHAFKGTIDWVQYNTSNEQRVQILNLLFALLVNENAMTPVQNTLLRFLGDAFGLGHVKLDRLYFQAFGQPLPQFSRVDKPNWWDLQDNDGPKRWDARSVARQAHEIQYRVKLGLPLSGKLDQSAILASFERAEDRCAPQQFSLLTVREQTLAERQLAKFNLAKDALLEVLA